MRRVGKAAPVRDTKQDSNGSTEASDADTRAAACDGPESVQPRTVESDPGPKPIQSLWGIGRPRLPPPSRTDGKRRAGDYVLGAQRIKAEVASRHGDALNVADSRHAEAWMDTAFRPVPNEMVEIGVGRELIPVEDEGGALVLRHTLEDTHYVAADASRDRLDLAQRAGVLELGLDAVETIHAENSVEKMLAHQLAAAHRSSMGLTEQLNRCIERMNVPDPEARERANIQATRLAGAIARLNGSYQQGALTVMRLRTGGRQVMQVIHQHVEVNEGGQAVVAGKVKAQAGGARNRKKGVSENGR